jgi:hypothetical protein
MQITVKQSNGQRSSAIRDARDRRCAPTITGGRPSQDDIVHRGKVALPDNSGRLRGSRRALHARLPLLLTKSPCANLPLEAGSRRVLGATPGTPASHQLSHTPPPPPKAGGGFISSRPPRQRHAQNGSRCGIICPIRCPAFQCWNLSSSNAAGAGTGGCTIKRERSSPAGGKEPERPPDITRIELCSCRLRRDGRRTISNPRKPGGSGVDARLPLAPAANACKTAGLTPAARTERHFSRLGLARANDPLRCADVGWRYDAATGRRLGTERSVTGRWRRRIGTERRHPRRVSDPAGITDHAGVGRAIRYAVDRRITGAGRTGRWRKLRKRAGRDQQAAKQCEADKRRMAGHWISCVLPAPTTM